MPQWKIMITDGLEENGQQILRQSAEVVDARGITADDLLKTIGEYDAVIVRSRTKITAAVFQAAGKKLKVVGRAGVGVDNIDLAAAQAHHVTVVNSPTATTIAVAELTLGMMLALVRELPRADASMKAGKWLKKELEGTELYEKVLGIIGIGRIGKSVAHRAAAFGMKIIATDPLVKPDDVKQLGIELVSLDDLCARADFITLHLPLTPETHNMINADRIAKMKPGVRIIDIARGGTIDEEALLAALDAGHVAGAALDVFATEPPGATALVCHPHVVVTPHIGAQSIEAQQRAAVDIATEILAALNGEPLRWKVA